MYRLLRFFARVSLIPLICALVLEAYLFVTSNVTLQALTWLLAGMGAYLLLYVVLFGSQGKTIQFLETLKHELSHAVISLLLFQMPQVFSVDVRDRKVTGKTTVVGLTGPAKGWFFNSLAPYYLPVFTIPLLPLKPILPLPLRNVADFLIGFSLALHYVTVVKQFRLYQTDIKNTGRIFSTTITLLFTLIWLVIILCVVTNNYAGIVTYFKSSGIRAMAMYKAIPNWWQITILPALKWIWENLKQLWE